MDPQQNPIEQNPNWSPPSGVPRRRFFLLAGVGIVLAVLVLSLVILTIPSGQTPPSLPTPTPIPTQKVLPSVTRIPTEYLKQAQDQAAADKNYGDYIKNINQNYPWYNSLPLQTKDYFVYFDLTKKVFIAKIYTHNDSSTVPFIKSLISNQLKNLGVDLSKYSIEWRIQ